MYVEPEMAHYYLSILKEGKASSNAAYTEKKFREFHDSLYMDLYRKIRARYRCDHDVAEDVLSEVFIKVFTTNHYPIPTTFYAWLMVICRNEAVNVFRKNSKKMDFGPEIERELNSNSEEVIPEFLRKPSDKADLGLEGITSNDGPPRDSATCDELGGDQLYAGKSQKTPSPESELDVVLNQAMEKDLIDCVRRAIKNIRSRSIDKALAIEWQMEGLSSKEIADLLKKSDEATRRLLSDAKKILRETMRPCYQLLNEA